MLGEKQPPPEPSNPDAEPKDPAQRIITWAQRYHEKWEAGAAQRQAQEQEHFQPSRAVLDEVRSYLARRTEALATGREAYAQAKDAALEDRMENDAEYELAAQMLADHSNEERIQSLQSNLRARLWQQQRERSLQQIRERATDFPPRNIISHFEQTADAIADIEGDAWASRQASDAKFWGDEHMPQHDTTLMGVLTRLQKCEPGEAGQQVLYGDGGFNRWYISSEGDVGFSRSHAVANTGDTEESLLQKIELLGFKIL